MYVNKKSTPIRPRAGRLLLDLVDSSNCSRPGGLKKLFKTWWTQEVVQDLVDSRSCSRPGGLKQL